MKLSSLAKDLEPYLVKLIRNIVGNMEFTSSKISKNVGIQLFDYSSGEVLYYSVSDDGKYDAILAAGDGDVIQIPPGAYSTGLPLTDNASSPEVACVGLSRVNVVMSGSAVLTDLTAGSSVENMTMQRTLSSGSAPSGSTYYEAGTATIINCTLGLHNTGTGDGQGIYVSTSSSILDIWNSTIIGDADTGDGFAIWADQATVNCYNCLLQASHADIIKETSSGTINLFGCRLEEI